MLGLCRHIDLFQLRRVTRAGFLIFVFGLFSPQLSAQFNSLGDIQLNSYGTERMRVTVSGWVGIGTTTPRSALDVFMSGTASAIIVPSDSTGNRPAAGFQVNGMLRYNTTTNKFEAYENGAWVNMIGNSSQWTTAGNDIYFNSGNVGIGTAAPSSSFHVEATSSAFLNRLTGVTTGWVGALKIEATSTGDMTDNFGPAAAFFIKDNANVENMIGHISGRRNGADNTGDLVFATALSGTVAEKVRISSGGNVGIGTAGPRGGLDVNATGTMSALIVPRDTTGNRPAAGFQVNGMIRYNTTSNKFEAYENGAWTDMIGSASYPLAGSLGSASAPTYSFTGDTDTGWFSPGAGILAASTNQTERIRIDANGSVGIGTSSPDFGISYSSPVRVLAVTGDGSASASSTGVLALANNRATPTVGDLVGGVDFVSVGNGTGSAQLGARVRAVLVGSGGVNGFGSDLTLSTKSDNGGVAERMRLTSAGHVGIGTTAPRGSLELATTGTMSALIVPRDTTGNRPAAGFQVNGMIRYNTTTNKFEAYENGAWSNMIGGSSQWTTTGSDIYYTTGNVGIGITTPASPLHIELYSNSNSVSRRASQIYAYAQPTGAYSAQTLAVTGYASLETNQNGSTGSVKGGSFTGTNNQANTLGSSIGVEGQGQNGSTGIVTNATGVSGLTDNMNASGTITNARGVYSQVSRTAGTVTNGYGVFIDTITATNKWGLYQNDTAATNYFAGNVGVGTTNPRGILDIAATNTMSALIVPRATTGNRPAAGFQVNGMIRYNTTTNKFEAYENGAWANMIGGSSQWTTSATDIYYNTGNVAIGTTSSNYEMTVNGPGNDTALFVTSAGAGWNAIGIKSSGDAAYWNVMDDSSGNFNVWWYNSPVPAFTIAQSTLSSTAINIAVAGNVGIGSTNPRGALDIVSTGTLSALIVPRATTGNRPAAGFQVNGMLRYNTTTNKFEGYENGAWTNMIGSPSFPLLGSLGSVSATTYSFSGDPNTGIYSPGADQLALVTNGTNALYIDTSGNVGVGSTSPGAKLDVAGNVKLGTSGTAFTASGVCTAASTAYTAGTAVNFTCTGVPASTSVAVSCSPSAALAGYVTARATGTANQIAITIGVSATHTMTCMWMVP